MNDAEKMGVYLNCNKKADDLDLNVKLNGSIISLSSNTRINIGSFDSIDGLWNFLCGYEWGYEKGYLDSKLL